MKEQKRLVKMLGALTLMVVFNAAISYATPATHIWAPSTDVQPYKVFHLTHDVYAPVSRDAGDNRVTPTINLGLEVGVLPFKKLNMEIGFDIIQIGTAQDVNPLFLNAKLGIPENSLSEGMPAIAIGSYLIGGEKDVSDANVIYGKTAKTFGGFGRVSAGYYTGNAKVLLDEKGEKANEGVLLCWEKTVSKISDKLWVAVDYMGGENFLGTLNFGFAWSFTPNISVIFGYDRLNNQNLSGVADTFTTQLDLNF